RASILHTAPPCANHTLSLHDALPISTMRTPRPGHSAAPPHEPRYAMPSSPTALALNPAEPGSKLPRTSSGSAKTVGCPGQLRSRSEEHTSELQSRENLVCRLLLEKKK